MCDFMGTSNLLSVFFFFFNDTATTEIYTLSLHDALPISRGHLQARPGDFAALDGGLHVHVRVHGAFGFEVAQRGESVLERDARVARGENGAIGYGLLQE